jgi:replicative DNA helicase
MASMKAMQATKQWAQNYAIPIVSAAQLRKLPPGLEKPAEVDEEGTLKPRWFGLSDIFGSGEAKKSPDKVIFIYNPNDVPVDFDGKRRAYFKLPKHRNGQAGQTVPMCFFPAQTRFDEIDTRYE